MWDLVAFIVACLVLGATLSWLATASTTPPLPPTPPAHPLWGHVASLLYPVETLHERLGALARAYPMAVTLRIGPAWLPLWLSPPIVVLNDAALVRDAFASKHAAAVGHEPEILENVVAVMGGGLLGVDGPVWEARRAYIARRFLSKEALAAAAPIIEAHVARTVAALADRTDPHAPIDLCEDHLVPLLLDVIVQLMCGDDASGVDSGDDGDSSGRRSSVPASIARDMGVVFTEFNDRTFRPFKTLRRTSRAHREALPRIQAYIDGLIARRRAETRPGGRYDLLSILVGDNTQEDDADGKSASSPYQTDADIRAEALLFMFAGFESTSSTLSYAIHLLARHPDVQDNVRAEVAAWRRDGIEPSSVLRGGLPLTDAVLREAMRLYPIAHTLTRRVSAPIMVGPYRVPAGARLLVNNLAISNGDAAWTDAQAFSPERWMGPAGGGDRYASLPFGVGRRACPGQRLAVLEMKLALAALLERFRFTPDPDRPHVECRVTLVMRPYRYSVCCLPLAAHDKPSP